MPNLSASDFEELRADSAPPKAPRSRLSASDFEPLAPADLDLRRRIAAEKGGLEQPAIDPAWVLADMFTAGGASLGAGLGTAARAALRAGTESAVYQKLADIGQRLAGRVTTNPYIQFAAGVAAPTLTGALLRRLPMGAKVSEPITLHDFEEVSAPEAHPSEPKPRNIEAVAKPARQPPEDLAPQMADILTYVREQLAHGGGLVWSGRIDALAGLEININETGSTINRLLLEYARKLANSPISARAKLLHDAYDDIYRALDRIYNISKPGARPIVIMAEPGPWRPAFRHKMYQGRGSTREQVYGWKNVKGGLATPVLGPAQYYAFWPEDAKVYGTVTEHEVTLEKPFVIDSDQKWKQLLDDAGAQALHPTSEDFRNPKANFIAIDRVREYLRREGYDGMVVLVPQSPEGDDLAEVFEHSQVIVFPWAKGPTAQSKAIKGTTSELPAQSEAIN
jgi:hypothetical protein